MRGENQGHPKPFTRREFEAAAMRADLRRRAGGLLLTALLLLLALPPGARPESSAVSKPVPLRVAIDDNYPPFIFKDAAGALQGILVERWNAWSRVTGRPVELCAMDWGEALRRMAAGEFDVIDTLFRNAERERLYTFSPPYARIEVPIFFRRELSGIHDLASLRGFRVAANAGDYSVGMMRAAGVTDILEFPNYASIIEAAEAGRVDIFVIDDPPAQYFLHKAGLRDAFRRTAPVASGEFHRAVRKGGEALLAEVERGFAALPADLLARIDTKWYGRPLDAPRVPRWTLFVVAIVSLSVLLQLAAASLALSLVRVTGKTLAWPLIAAALCLMAVRRMVPICYFMLSPTGFEPNVFSETVGALLSLLMFVGVLRIRPIFEELRRAEKERERMRQELLQAQKLESVGRLAGGIAHDFNNLLQGIVGFTELLLDREGADGDPERREILQEIQNTGRRATDLTRHLLAFARRGSMTPERVDLNRAVEASLPFLRRMLGRSVEVVFEPAPGLWPVWIDPVQVDQVVMNLVTNARDAIDGRGRITLATGMRTLAASEIPPSGAGAPPGDYVTLAVADDGRGMDAGTLERIFEPFFTTKEKGRGTGLGLATVYGIARQAGGFVAVESAPGKGTLFTLFFPRHVARDSESQPPPAAEERREGLGERVLVVDDEPMLLAIARRFLEKLGYTVATADTPEEALALLDAPGATFDLLLADVRMPGMSGFELAAAARARKPGLACLFMSGFTDEADTAGAGDHPLITKPFSVERLSAAVRAALEKKA